MKAGEFGASNLLLAACSRSGLRASEPIERLTAPVWSVALAQGCCGSCLAGFDGFSGGMNKIYR
jgi:hypothetical protein